MIVFRNLAGREFGFSDECQECGEEVVKPEGGDFLHYLTSDRRCEGVPYGVARPKRIY